MAFAMSELGFYGGALPGFGVHSFLGSLATRPFFGPSWDWIQPAATPALGLRDIITMTLGDVPTSLLRSDIKEKAEQLATEIQGLPTEEAAKRIQEFTSQLGGGETGARAELVYQPEMLSSPYLEAPALEEVVRQQLQAEEKSPLWELLGTFGEEGVLRELQALLSGEETGALTAAITGRQPTEMVDRAVAAQLLRDIGPVKLASGEIFNPYSMDLQELVREYQLPSELRGHQLMEFGMGMLSKYDLGLTKERLGILKQAMQTGADTGYGGKKGYRLLDPLMDLAERLQPGKEISQAIDYSGRTLGWAFDVVYGGRAGGGFGKGLAELISGLA